MPAVLLLPILLLAQDKPPEKCSISGTVVNFATGEPLDKVEVQTEVVGNRGSSASTTSDANGHFTLPDLDPGQYRIKGKRNRFLDTYYGARRAESSGIPVVVEAGQNIKEVKFRLMPFGVIAGTVRDPEGEPLARIGVTALRARWVAGRRKVTAVDSAYTDEMGQYRITGLAPGRYYVRADPKRKMAGSSDDVFGGEAGFLVAINEAFDGAVPRKQPQVLLPALYPGVQEAQSARTVDLEIGVRLTGVDIGLPRSGTVTVKGHVAAPDGAHTAMITLSRGQWMGNSMDPLLMTSADDHNDFTFLAVPQGSYTLTATASVPVRSPKSVQVVMPGAPGGTVLTVDGQSQMQGQVPLDVGTTPVEGVGVVVSGGTEVTGQVVQADGKGPVPNGSVEFDDGVSDIRRSDIQNGNFTLDLPQGHYNISLNLDSMQQDHPLVIRSAVWNGRDIAAEGLTIAGPGKVALEIAAAPDGGTLDGVALDKDDKPVAGATVVLIPEAKLRSRRERYFEVETDQYGHFEIDGIIPGDYKALAWEDVEDGIWHDPDFVKSVESKGEPVTLKTGAHESTRLHVIPTAIP
jgi:hypothetical protein